MSAPSAGRVEIEPPGSSAVALPAVVVDAGPAVVERFPKFFAAAIANGRTRAPNGLGLIRRVVELVTGADGSWSSSPGPTPPPGGVG